ncbi:MAG: carboxypeptidase regulatory-like domain-containing protein [Chloroflexi bacterium]|nr:carboxypeptidase regulatory-like domain-containing protein [Chloroflexota bacterium]
MCSLAVPARASDPWMADAAQIEKAFQQHPAPHAVVVVFDVSGSMRSRVPETGLTRWQEARAATSEVLTSSLKPGDDLTILPFDAVVHDPEPHPALKGGEIASLGQLIPSAITGEAGTNMRLAHSRALDLLNRQYAGLPAGKRPWEAIIVVSDGYNDAPPLHSAAWDDYARFCNVHSENQNLYPNTPECQTWRSDALKFSSSGEGETFGIGVKIHDGVPEYRPLNETPTETTPATPAASVVSGTVYNGDQPASGARVAALDSSGNEVDAATSGPDGRFTLRGLGSGVYRIVAAKNGASAEMPNVSGGNQGVDLHMAHNLIGVWIALIVLAILGVIAAAALSQRRRSSKVRIQVKDSSGRNRTFWLGGTTRVAIGGKEAPGTSVCPLDASPTTAAYLRHNASGFSLVTEKGIEVETGGRKFTTSGAVQENTLIQLVDSAGARGSFEFQDISTRARTAAKPMIEEGAAGAFSRLDANLRG